LKDLNFNHLTQITIVLIFSIAVFFILIVGQSIIVPLVVAVFLAFLLLPLASFFERRGLSRALSAISAILLAIIVLSGIIFLLGSQVTRFAKDMEDISSRLDELISFLPAQVVESVNNMADGNFTTFLKDNVSNILMGLSGFVSSFTFVIVIPIYIALILIYRSQFREFLFRVFDGISSKKDKNEMAEEDEDKFNIRQLIPRIKKIVQQYILGMFYVMCILFVLYSTALISLGIEHAILFAAIAGVFNIIPFVGPFIGSVLPILFALVSTDSLFYPAAVLVSFIVIQSIEGNLITPNIVGNNVNLNPLVTLVTLFIGAAIWGVIGMILFIPITAVLKEVLGNIHGLEAYAYVLGTGEKEKQEGGIWHRISDWIKAKFKS
jgi:predicted PurR-regulated permease PerM